MHTYLFDVKLFASLRIKAQDEKAAYLRLQEALDCVTANFGKDEETGDPIIGEVSLDDESADLVEVDGVAV